MKRREFLKSMTAMAAGSMVSAPAVWSPAKAQSRQETLLIVSESGPNNIDIHGVGTNVPGYEVSWNCYDRLISHEMKTVNGIPYYDRDKFKPELADDMNIGDMSVTFKLKRGATFHDGTTDHRQGREMVARPRRHASAASRPFRWAPARSPSPSNSSSSTTTPSASISRARTGSPFPISR